MIGTLALEQGLRCLLCHLNLWVVLVQWRDPDYLLEKHLQCRRTIKTRLVTVIWRNLIQFLPQGRLPHTAVVKTCPVCGTVFSSGKKMDMHIHTQHPDSHSFSCSQCTAIFATGHGLHVHTADCHPSRVFTCKQCMVTASSLYKMKLHIHVHLFQKLQCEICGQKLSTREALHAHMKLHLMQSLLSCNFCG